MVVAGRDREGEEQPLLCLQIIITNFPQTLRQQLREIQQANCSSENCLALRVELTPRRLPYPALFRLPQNDIPVACPREPRQQTTQNCGRRVGVLALTYQVSSDSSLFWNIHRLPLSGQW
ncbi:hypothetical protein BaRGS_00010577, partial [Batillaria attramentaria]